MLERKLLFNSIEFDALSNTVFTKWLDVLLEDGQPVQHLGVVRRAYLPHELTKEAGKSVFHDAMEAVLSEINLGLVVELSDTKAKLKEARATAGGKDDH